jgi:hypothetical protein
MRPPGLGSSHFHNVPSPTPRCEQTVQLSVYPRLLSAFPRRRYGRLTQLSITRLIRVHGYYGPLFCIFFQGHLSRRFAPQTRPPARSPNGRLGSGDLHPMSLTSVPACRRQTLPYRIMQGLPVIQEQSGNHVPQIDLQGLISFLNGLWRFHVTRGVRRRSDITITSIPAESGEAI